ncbi:MAG: hypothetical protein KJ674_03280 [Nanoarchaeota archaeon]|nr:hypothetical protein [Nanoarchaeota archaeon]
MNEYELNKLLEDQKYLESKIDYYKNNKIITKQIINDEEVKGHLEKANHNLMFVNDNLKKFSDWSIVGCYYVAYHIALALILKKGFSSKNHDATLCLLINYYYMNGLNLEDIELLNKTYLDNEDILFYLESKIERERASYSSQIDFDKKNINNLRLKTVLFVNKCKEILKE